MLDIQSEPIDPMKAQHLSHSHGTACRLPCPRKIHVLELVDACNDPSLAMLEADDALSMISHFISLQVFPRPRIEVLSQSFISVGYRCCHCPHRISQCDRRAHLVVQVACCKITRSMYYRAGRVYPVEIYTMPGACQSALA